ncbi:MAG TPA: hypothetical protein VGX25_25290 [Actinophytocola sp.]|uniref:hypothetical protein n=1 Tax=Actinophytocola sp. TaxID=1872138 RepID=UPI002DDCC6FE|nr:hypothetical protein [Actinophytocola sp.]HEV2782720.1 hypothetical protein [Actinophytocola sp.]
MFDHSESVELPPYRAVLVVDARAFGSNSDPDQELLAEAVPDVVALAFERAALTHVWENALFPHNTGDGMGIGFDVRHLPSVVDRFFDALQDVLAERDRRWRAHDRRVRLQLRASLNVGPVREPDAGGKSAVVGSTVITTHRLLDSPPVRAVLTRSDPEQTFLAVVLSQRVFDDVLASGYARLPASRVVPTFVRVKEFAGTVYLYVPNPSGDLLTHGIGEYQQQLDAAAAAQADPQPGSVTNTMTGTHSGPAIQVGHLHGGLHTGPS